MPKQTEVRTAATEAEELFATAAQTILAEIQGLAPWKNGKGVRFEDRMGGGKPLFAVLKNGTLHLYLGAKERRCEVGSVRLVSEQGDNEFRVVNALRLALHGPHGGEVLAVLQQI